MDDQNAPSNPLPGRSRSRWRAAFTLGRQLAKPLFAVLALYWGLVVLQCIGVVSYTERSSEHKSVRFHPIPSGDRIPVVKTDERGVIKVSGKAPRGSQVELGINERVVDVAVSHIDGTFSAGLPLPPQAKRVWVRALDQQFQEIDRDERELEWDPNVPGEPVLTVCFHITDLGELWLAGQALPRQEVRIEARDGTCLCEPVANEIGIFDILIPVTGNPPDMLSVRPSGGPESPASALIAPKSIVVKELPLSRKATIYPKDITAIAQISPTLDSHDENVLPLNVLRSLMDKIEIQISLPASHPCFAALAKGYMSASDFVESTFGLFAGMLSTEEVRVLKKSSYGAFGQFEDLVSPPSLTIQQQTGVVTLVAYSFDCDEFHTTFANNRGIASAPFLTGNDQIDFRFDKKQPEYFDGTLPVEISSGTAIWRGPMQLPSESSSIHIGYSPSRYTAEYARLAKKTGSAEKNNDTLRDFLAGLETRITGNPLERIWRAMIAAIPFAGLIWLVRRYPLGSSEVWRPIIAMTILLAIWGSWSFFYQLVVGGAADELSRATLMLVDGPMVDKNRPEFNYAQLLSIFTQSDVGRSAFWLMFVALVGLTPFYFGYLASYRFDPMRRQRDGQRQPFLRKLLTLVLIGLRRLYLLVWLLAFLYLTTLLFRGGIDTPLAAFTERIRPWVELGERELSCLAALAALALFLLGFGLRAFLFGLGLLLFATYSAEAQNLPFGVHVPQPFVLLLVGAATYPLLSRLLARIVPFRQDRMVARRLTTVLLILVSLLLPALSAKILLILSAVLITLGVGWAALCGIGYLRPSRARGERSHPSWWRCTLVLAALGFVLGWPFSAEGRTLHLRELSQFMDKLDNSFLYIMALGVILQMWRHARKTPEVFLDKTLIVFGMYFFVAFTITVSTSWILIPVPFLVGLLLARFWVFQPGAKVEGLRESVRNMGPRDLKQLVAKMIAGTAARARLTAIQKTLASQLEKAALSPKDYAAKSAEYESYFAEQAAANATPASVSLRTLTFGIGGPDVTSNLVAALKAGALLSVIPILVAMYQYLPVSKASYPYCIADFLIFSVLAVAKWLLYAFFFGYFFTHLRGASGLTKGIWLFLALTVPFAAYRLLSTQSLVQMRPFFLWSAQVFLYCSLLGLLAVDLRLLRENGFRPSDLKIVHSFPTLSAYASVGVAALVPAITAIFTSRISEVAKFFVETVLPNVPLSK